jgi:type II secretory pathway component GspD/PulD (secretin)
MARLRFRAACAALIAAVVSAGLSVAGEAPTAAERLRQVLDRVCEIEVPARPLHDAVKLLSEQTGVTFAFDPDLVKVAAAATDFIGPPAPGTAPDAPALVVEMYATDQPLRVALKKALDPFGLSAVVVGDRIVIARQAVAPELQMRQPVTVDADRRELADLLRDLGRRTGANVVLDPKAAKDTRGPVTLRLDDTPLESAVALLADVAGLQSVRLGNVLYVTTDARAAILRAEAAASHVPAARTAKPAERP